MTQAHVALYDPDPATHEGVRANPGLTCGPGSGRSSELCALNFVLSPQGDRRKTTIFPHFVGFELVAQKLSRMPSVNLVGVYIRHFPPLVQRTLATRPPHDQVGKRVLVVKDANFAKRNQCTLSI